MLVVEVVFLPLGADRNAAVFRVVAGDERPYFVKLRRGVFDEIAVALPKFLSDQGISQIIAPLATKTRQLWASLGSFQLIPYPFVEGHNGYEVDLSDRHWGDLGTALKSIHPAEVPASLTRRIQQETCSPQWRQIVRAFLGRVDDGILADPL